MLVLPNKLSVTRNVLTLSHAQNVLSHLHLHMCVYKHTSTYIIITKYTFPKCFEGENVKYKIGLG